MALNLDPYQGVFGLPPPTSSISDDMIRNSMPVLEITPGEPNFSSGLSLFRINTSIGWKNYTRILANHGFTLGAGTGATTSGKPLKLAFIADNFPTDTFTNEYTETFLQKFTDVASGGLSQMIQMSGAKTMTGAVGNYADALSSMGAAFGEGSTVGGVVTKGAEYMNKAKAGLRSFQKAMETDSSGFKRVIGGGVGLIDKMLAGHRIDFPQIWSNSGYSPSYSITVRLYNPNPGNRNSTLKYIAGPLCAILCLAVPRTDNGASYRWPYYHKMRVRGLYELNPAVITNVTVVKGGDQQQIAFNQAMSIVDVRLDFVSLHKSMLLEEDKVTTRERPTVRSYIQELTSDRGTITRAQMNNDNATRVGLPDQQQQKVDPPSDAEKKRLENNRAVGTRLPQLETEGAVLQDRVPTDTKALEVINIDQAQDGTYARRVDPETARGR